MINDAYCIEFLTGVYFHGAFHLDINEYWNWKWKLKFPWKTWKLEFLYLKILQGHICFYTHAQYIICRRWLRYNTDLAEYVPVCIIILCKTIGPYDFTWLPVCRLSREEEEATTVSEIKGKQIQSVLHLTSDSQVHMHINIWDDNPHKN